MVLLTCCLCHYAVDLSSVLPWSWPVIVLPWCSPLVIYITMVLTCCLYYHDVDLLSVSPRCWLVSCITMELTCHCVAMVFTSCHLYDCGVGVDLLCASPWCWPLVICISGLLTAGTGRAELLPEHGGSERPTGGQQCGVQCGGAALCPLPPLLLLLLPQHSLQGTEVSGLSWLQRAGWNETTEDTFRLENKVVSSGYKG